MSGYVSGGYSNQPIAGLSSVIDTFKGVARDARDSRERTRHLNMQHRFAVEQMGYAHQLGIERDLQALEGQRSIEQMRNLQEFRMAHVNANLGNERAEGDHARATESALLQDRLASNRERISRAASTRSANRDHRNAKDMVTHVATTLGGVQGQGPISGMTVPGGSISFSPGGAEPPPARKPRKASPAKAPAAPASKAAPAKAPAARKPAARKSSAAPRKAPGAPTFSSAGADPGPQSGAPRTPRRPL